MSDVLAFTPDPGEVTGPLEERHLRSPNYRNATDTSPEHARKDDQIAV